jgi:hypothetical protein
MIDMILDNPAAYVAALSLPALRAQAIFVHSGIIGASWDDMGKARRAFRVLQDAINAR